MTKVGKLDGEGTYAGTRGNDEDAPIPDARKGGLPPANSTLIADLRRGEHIVSDLPEVNIGELSAISAVIAVCCA
jgi:hypothetical protein